MRQYRNGQSSLGNGIGWSEACLLFLATMIVLAISPGAAFSQITLSKTVGTDPNTCSASDTITVASGTPVYYCYTVTNISSATYSFHDLEDDQLGTILSNFPFELAPGFTIFVTQEQIATSPIVNTATWTVREPTGLPIASATDSATVDILEEPRFGITLTKTVGTDPDACGATDSIVVPEGETVYYCYTVENVGSATVSYHSLEDDVLGPILTDFALDLPPGGMVSVTAASVVMADVVNTATWTVSDSTMGQILDMDVDTAMVLVTTPSTVTPTPTPTEEMVVSTPTFTPTTGPCDSGYYILDSLGGRHRVGNPINIIGPVYFGTDIARDLERATCSTVSDGTDLVVLDGFGVAHFVAHESCNISQDFYFGDPATATAFPQGRAVDLQMTIDSAGFWVLTDFGGIYRAGTAQGGGASLVPNTDQTGVLGFDIPTMRDPGTASLPVGNATLRAVSFFAIDEDGDSLADGYVVLDSMGGQFRFEANGDPVVAGSRAGEPPNDPEHLLDPSSYVWPFFPGLDIARDMELHPTQTGTVILDGWDGIHPVPVNDPSNPVWFARNEDTMGGYAQAVGMPYVVLGFDDPDTPELEDDPANNGPDAESIFVDLEFSAGCPNSGLYTLDKFGAVFVLGSARPVETEPVPNFVNSPYFFPFLYAEDMEIFGADETDTGVPIGPPDGGTETKFTLFW